MKKEAQRKLLKSISEVSDALIEGKICWYGKEGVESAIMDFLSDFIKRQHYHGLLEDALTDYLPQGDPMKE